MITSVLICLRYNPSRGVGNSLKNYFNEVDGQPKLESLQDTRLFPEGRDYEVNASPLRHLCPNPTNGGREDRYKKCVVFSEIVLQRRAKIWHYSQCRILFERQIHRES